MKKRWCIAILSALFLMTACSSKQPEPSCKEQVTQFLTAVKQKDSTQVEALSNWDKVNIDALTISKEDYLRNVDEQLQKDVYDKLQFFSFTVEKETIKKQDAQVDIKLTTYDFTDSLKKGMAEAEKTVEKLSKQSDVSDAQAEAAIHTVLLKELNKTKAKKDASLTLQLHKENSTWIILKNQPLQDALSANLHILEDK